MKWDEVIELEKRTEEDLYKINLILEGEFWHGYEWSAYLCNHFPSDKLGNEGALKPNRKKYNDGDIISVGLKFSSFDKYFPNIKDNKPKNLNEMFSLAAKLSEPFKFVRVDFYEIEGKVYLGELTFTPGAMVFRYKNKEDEIKIGNLLKL